jgi:hypothetical protein
MPHKVAPPSRRQVLAQPGPATMWPICVCNSRKMPALRVLCVTISLTLVREMPSGAPRYRILDAWPGDTNMETVLLTAVDKAMFLAAFLAANEALGHDRSCTAAPRSAQTLRSRNPQIQKACAGLPALHQVAAAITIPRDTAILGAYVTEGGRVDELGRIRTCAGAENVRMKPAIVLTDPAERILGSEFG